jgi:ABC-type sugar transport system ATPase subunit
VKKTGGVFLEVEDFSLPTPFEDLFWEDFIGKKVIAAIRPEAIRISVKEEREAISGKVYSLLPAVADVIVQVKRGNITFTIREMGEVSLEVGDKIYLQLSKDGMIFYDEEKGVLLFPHP